MQLAATLAQGRLAEPIIHQQRLQGAAAETIGESGSVCSMARLVGLLAWIIALVSALVAVGLPAVAWLSMGGEDLFVQVVAFSLALAAASVGAVLFGRRMWRSANSVAV